MLGPAVAAGKFSAYGFPSLGPGAGKGPVGACVLTRVLYACGGRMSRGGETLSFSRFTEPIFAFWVPLQFRTTKTHRHSFSFRRLLLLGTVLQSLCAAPSQKMIIRIGAAILPPMRSLSPTGQSATAAISRRSLDRTIGSLSATRYIPCMWTPMLWPEGQETGSRRRKCFPA